VRCSEARQCTHSNPLRTTCRQCQLWTEQRPLQTRLPAPPHRTSAQGARGALPRPALPRDARPGLRLLPAKDRGGQRAWLRVGEVQKGGGHNCNVRCAQWGALGPVCVVAAAMTTEWPGQTLAGMNGEAGGRKLRSPTQLHTPCTCSWDGDIQMAEWVYRRCGPGGVGARRHGAQPCAQVMHSGGEGSTHARRSSAWLAQDQAQAPTHTPCPGALRRTRPGGLHSGWLGTAWQVQTPRPCASLGQ
jgi:hypothetical protein